MRKESDLRKYRSLSESFMRKYPVDFTKPKSIDKFLKEYIESTNCDDARVIYQAVRWDLVLINSLLPVSFSSFVSRTYNYIQPVTWEEVLLIANYYLEEAKEAVDADCSQAAARFAAALLLQFDAYLTVRSLLKMKKEFLIRPSESHFCW